MQETNVIGIMRGGYEMANRVYDSDGTSPTLRTYQGGNLEPKFLQIKQADKKGYAECEFGGVADLNYASSSPSRGRCIENGTVCPTLTTENIPSVLEDWTWEVDGVKYIIRIRKLTPKECFRLMDFTDEEHDVASKVCSNSQLYKQAGNSIVVNCMTAIFGQMIPGKEEVYKHIEDGY